MEAYRALIEAVRGQREIAREPDWASDLLRTELCLEEFRESIEEKITRGLNSQNRKRLHNGVNIAATSVDLRLPALFFNGSPVKSFYLDNIRAHLRREQLECMITDAGIHTFTLSGIKYNGNTTRAVVTCPLLSSACRLQLVARLGRLVWTRYSHTLQDQERYASIRPILSDARPVEPAARDVVRASDPPNPESFLVKVSSKYDLLEYFSTFLSYEDLTLRAAASVVTIDIVYIDCGLNNAAVALETLQECSCSRALIIINPNNASSRVRAVILKKDTRVFIYIYITELMKKAQLPRNRVPAFVWAQLLYIHPLDAHAMIAEIGELREASNSSSFFQLKARVATAAAAAIRTVCSTRHRTTDTELETLRLDVSAWIEKSSIYTRILTYGAVAGRCYSLSTILHHIHCESCTAVALLRESKTEKLRRRLAAASKETDLLFCFCSTCCVTITPLLAFDAAPRADTREIFVFFYLLSVVRRKNNGQKNGSEGEAGRLHRGHRLERRERDTIVRRHERTQARREFSELVKNRKKDETDVKPKEIKEKVKEIKKEKDVKEVKKEIVTRDSSKSSKDSDRKKEDIKKIKTESEIKKESKMREAKEVKKEQKATKGRSKVKEEPEDIDLYTVESKRQALTGCIYRIFYLSKRLSCRLLSGKIQERIATWRWL
ncbi:unnamed protein product [Trichogramma brassicae]|uniref:Uncharacterized protein n=1 Tax=Trichogramma brassicae TaxID=86971 RepID=A0A6H5HZ15_9HYME|nr:unnamed protein product [Trichogramma brassicae]